MEYRNDAAMLIATIVTIGRVAPIPGIAKTQNLHDCPLVKAGGQKTDLNKARGLGIVYECPCNNITVRVDVNRLQRRNQRAVADALGKSLLITSIDVSSGGFIDARTATWEEYWACCDCVAEEIGRLRVVWDAFIAGGHSVEQRCPFVGAYFALLHTCLTGYFRGEVPLPVLRKVVGFETFSVSCEQGQLAAGTFNIRNPAYLLSRGTRPRAPEDPKFLPLICPYTSSSCHFDLVLMLRICDVFSRFQIEAVSCREARTLIRRERDKFSVDMSMIHPARLIEENRLDGLHHRLWRTPFRNGMIFHQFSLSDYFGAIKTVLGDEVSGVEGAIYAPIRRFDETALILPSGRSLIGELMTMTDKILVEDWDLTANRLRRHIDLFALKDLSVTDLTDRRGGRGASVAVIGKRQSPTRFRTASAAVLTSGVVAGQQE